MAGATGRCPDCQHITFADERHVCPTRAEVRARDGLVGAAARAEEIVDGIDELECHAAALDRQRRKTAVYWEAAGHIDKILALGREILASTDATPAARKWAGRGLEGEAAGVLRWFNDMADRPAGDGL